MRRTPCTAEPGRLGRSFGRRLWQGRSPARIHQLQHAGAGRGGRSGQGRPLPLAGGQMADERLDDGPRRRVGLLAARLSRFVVARGRDAEPRFFAGDVPRPRGRSSGVARRDSAGAVPGRDRHTLSVARPRTISAHRGRGQRLYALRERAEDRLQRRFAHAGRISRFGSRDRRTQHDRRRGLRLLRGRLDGDARAAYETRYAR